MAKLRWKIGEKEYEIEGEPSEILKIHEELTGKIEHPSDHSERSAKPAGKPSVLNAKVPEAHQIIEFILSKPNYAHNSIEIQEQFLKRRVTSRGYPSLYRRLVLNIEKARQEIERTKSGKFEAHRSIKNQEKTWTFKPSVQSIII
jgi:hypothetical protein